MSSPDFSGIPPELQRAQTYRVGETIARGGMGAVLRVEDAKVQREVAMKVMLPVGHNGEESLRRFLLEARVLGQLEHPNIVPLYELGLDAEGRVFYTMKLVKGVTLRAVLDALKAGDAATLTKYPLVRLLTVYQKVCDAIAFAHSRGIIHRDLKPENIMLGDFGEVLVMDWGLAKVLSAPAEEVAAPTARDAAALQASARDGAGMQTMEGSVMGTPFFMAPEQAEGRVHDLDARTDIFALGGILYILLTLHPPVTGSTVQEVLENILTGYIAPPLLYNKVRSPTVRPPQATVPGPADLEMAVEAVDLRHCPDGRVPEALSAVAMKALSVDPARRYQTVADLQQDITAFQNGFATTAEHAGRVRHFRLFLARNKTLATAAVVLVALTVAFLAEVISKEHAARVSLAKLRATAPTFHDQALTLLDGAQVTEALDKIDFALTLKADELSFLLIRANILQTLQRLDEAHAAYERVLKADPANARATQNLLLCDKLDKETGGGKEWPLDTLKAFNKALVDQGRSGEALYLNRFLAKDNQSLAETWRAKLAAAQIRPNRMVTLSNGRFDVSLSRLPVDDLTPLKGMPIETLQVAGTKIISLGPLAGMSIASLDCNATRVNSLEPLRDMPLKWLSVAGTEVSDLSPLQGMPLDGLNLQVTRVVDLAPLKGLPLTFLNLESTAVKNLTPLAGAPLKTLNLRFCNSITNLSPLIECKELEQLSLPGGARDYSVVRQMPALKYVEHNFGRGPVRESVEDFVKRLDAQGKPTLTLPMPSTSSPLLMKKKK